jgi:hypothetical protein
VAKTADLAGNLLSTVGLLKKAVPGASLIGRDKNRLWYLKAERLCGPHVYNQLEPRRRDNSRGRGCRLHRATRNHLPDWMTDKWRASCASFVGMPFKTVDEALEAISREFKAIGSGGALAVVAGRTAATPNRALRGHVARLASTISYR